MRYTTVTLTWDNAHLHPLDDAFMAKAGVYIEAIYYINPVGDGYAELSQLRGDFHQARKLLRELSEVVRFELSEDGITYVHYEASQLMDDLLGVLFEHAIVFKWPIKFIETNGNQGLRITFLGTSRAIGRALDDIPSVIEVSLIRTGEYDGTFDHHSSILTERQREILDVAVKGGYYEIPRRTTHREIAAELSLAPGTVSEHIQRIERILIPSLASSQ